MSDRRQSALNELVRIFERNGVLRLPDAKRRSKHPRTYKKGYEVRFVAYTSQELRHIRHLLREAGFPVAKSFSKVRRFVQPLYGKQHVEWFCEVVEDSRD